MRKLAHAPELSGDMMSAVERVEKLLMKAAQARRLASEMPQTDTVEQLLKIADQFESEAEDLCQTQTEH